jgi:EF hand
MHSLSRSFPALLLSLVLGLPAASAPSQPPGQQEARPKPAPPVTQKQEKAPDPYAERFQQLDRDRDGYVTLAEWPLDAESFAVVDRDKDGRLSRGELLTPNTLRRDRQEKRFRQLDTDGDGALSPAERRRDRTLDRLDSNRDGYVSRQEAGRGDPENVWNPRTAPRTQQFFRDNDRNSDNRLGILEWTGPAARFHRLDMNRDGFLSPQELSRQ